MAHVTRHFNLIRFISQDQNKFSALFHCQSMLSADSLDAAKAARPAQKSSFFAFEWERKHTNRPDLLQIGKLLMIFTTINLFQSFQRDKTDYVLSRDNEFRGGVETSAESIAWARRIYVEKKRVFLHWAQTWRVHSHTLSNVYLLLSVAAHLFAKEVLSFWRRLSRFTCLWFLSHLLCGGVGGGLCSLRE